MSLAARTAALVVLFWARSANAQPLTVDYVVAPGDSCRSIARARFGDAARIDLIHAHNPGLGSTPHRLTPGNTLRLPSAAMATAEAGVARVVRQVELGRASASTWSAAQVGATLQRGDRVATGDGSASELLFRDGGVLQMRQRSLVVITGRGRPSPRPMLRATLEHGALRGRLGELAGRATIRTPSAAARLGEDAIVAVDAEGVSRIASLEGEAVVDGVRVPEGTGTEVRPGGRPSRPRPLPEAPRWRDDAAGRFMGLAHSGATLRGGWEPVADALAFRVEIAREADGTGLLAAVEVPGDAVGFTIPRIAAGTYYVSVATIDRRFFEGRPSPRRAMVVLEARLVPPGGGTPPPDRLDPGDPSRPFSPPRALPGTWVVAPLGFECGDDADVGNITTLRALGRRVVRCEDARGRAVEGFEVVVVEARIRARRPFLRRGERRRLRLVIETPLALPERLLARAPEGIAAGSVRRVRNHYEVDVGASQDAPDTVTLVLEVAAGSERIRVGQLTLAVR